MEVQQEKKKYKVQVFIFREKEDDEKYMEKKVIRLQSGEEKMFKKHDHVDCYLVMMKGDKIVKLIRQTMAICSIKFLMGYEINMDGTDKNDSFFQFQVLAQNLNLGKSKVPSEYRELFKNREKRFEKLQEYEGHKFKDLILYPEEMIKDITLSKSQYFLSKKQSETESDSSQSSSSDDSSDDSSDSSSEQSEKSRRRKNTKDKKIKKDKKEKEKERERKNRKRKDRDRSKDRKKKSKEDKTKRNRKDSKHKRSKSKERAKKSRDDKRDDKKKHKDKDKKR